MAWAPSSAGQAPPGDARGGRLARDGHPPVANAEYAGQHHLRRYPDRGLLGGVGAGIAKHLGVQVLIVRLVMAVVMTAGGVGLVLYALGWALIPVAAESRGLPRRHGAWREGVLMVLAAAVVLYGLRRAGLLIGDGFIWPLVLGACGMALVWRPAVTRRMEPMRWPPSARSLWGRIGRIDLPRVVIGALLVAFSAAALLHAAGVLHSLGMALGAVAIVGTILGLLLGPWVVGLARSLASERAARIREQERAEMAAHLHDSVLQTLALIQRRAGDPREVAGLARRQERELRHWLQARPATCGDDSVAEALERAAAEVEELHRVPIEVVTVGDRPIDNELEAMVQAAREAMTNAAKFAQTERVDLYVEVEPERVEVYVRDRGVGFDPATIPPDRRGVRDSIIARMERHHGRAAVHSVPGEGTEVELVMERRHA